MSEPYQESVVGPSFGPVHGKDFGLDLKFSGPSDFAPDSNMVRYMIQIFGTVQLSGSPSLVRSVEIVIKNRQISDRYGF